MDSFSYTDSVRAAFASCLPCFTSSRSDPPSSAAPNSSSSNAANPTTTLSAPPRSASLVSARPSSDLERLLHDTESDALSLHSNLGTPTHRRARHRRRPKFSLTLFGYTLFGRSPIYLSDDGDDDGSGENDLRTDGWRARALATTSSSTLDSDAAPLDASTIERLTSPDHLAALAAQRERERQQLEAEEEAHRKAQRRARKEERKARARAAALMSFNGTVSSPDADVFEGLRGSVGESGLDPESLLFRQAAVEGVSDHHPDPESLSRDDGPDGFGSSHSGDDADLGGELYTRKKKRSAALSASGSDSRSRTSASLSAGDTSHIQNVLVHGIHQSIPYPRTEMHHPPPPPVKKKSHRASKRTSTVSSVTSQSTSRAPYTPVESVADSLAVATFPVPEERYTRDRGPADFPSVGLSGKRNPKSLDPRAFLAHQQG